MEGLNNECGGTGGNMVLTGIAKKTESPKGKRREETNRKEKASIYNETQSESWHGFVKDANCALLLGEAVESGRLGVVRGPIRNGHLQIGGGSVLVLEDSEALSRWRDGMNWSASKKVGGFLLYRQVKVGGQNAQSDKQIGAQFPPYKFSKLLKSTALFHTGSLRPNTVLHPRGLAKRTIVITTSSGARFKIINYFYPEQVEHHFRPAGFPRTLNALDCPADLPEFRIFVKNRYLPSSISVQPQIPNGPYDSATEIPVISPPSLNLFSHSNNSAMHLQFILDATQNPQWMERYNALPPLKYPL
ncbi:hypothetical protein HK100_004629 [Physocladia obscura]|uniref:Uncharacterized protein n=1 Tax=Physocladia obscura TaxID=109957 RepID=A0AAD5X9T6_9FUNG|nr:hypothetical protein HK100_004629 [Physocladia obscura]